MPRIALQRLCAIYAGTYGCGGNTSCGGNTGSGNAGMLVGVCAVYAIYDNEGWVLLEEQAAREDIFLVLIQVYPISTGEYF